MNLFLKQVQRKPLISGLMVFLLGISMTMCCVGQSSVLSTRLQRELISSEYTTVAIPLQPDLSNLNVNEIGLALQKRVLADQEARNAPHLAMIDRRCLLSAHIPGSLSLSSSSVDPSEYNAAFDDEAYSLSVFALRCYKVTEKPAEDIFSYDAAFSVEEIISRSSAYDCFPSPETIHVYSQICTRDGSVPFEEGKTYLVFGLYHDYPVKTGMGLFQDEHDHEHADYTQLTTENRYIIPFPEISSNLSREPSSVVMHSKGSMTYLSPSDNLLPWYVEYRGGLRPFLASDEASVWNEIIIPCCQLNQESASVILTDKATSMYSFNTGDQSIVSGRFFTQEEYEQGRDVCVVSAAYAALNNWNLGDSITMEFYDSGFGEFSNGATSNSIFSAKDPGSYWQRHYFLPEDGIGVSKSYTIVGLYIGPRFVFSSYSFNADTIIIPKASVPDAEAYETLADPLMNSFVLKNGTADAFESYLSERGFGGQFLYLDQDFSATEESIKAAEKSAERVLFLGIGATILTTALFLLLNNRRIERVIYRARILGRPPIQVWREIMSVHLLQIGIGTALGIIFSLSLFEIITEGLMSSALTPQSTAIIVTALLLFVIIVIASSCAAWFEAKKNLMNWK